MKEKWSVGTYIVPLQNRLLSSCETLIAYKPYKIIRNYQIPIIKSENGVEINFCPLGVSVEEREGIRWFETYEEALKFSKKNIYLPDYVECISSELSYIKPGVVYKFECKTDLRSLLLKCNVDSLYTAGTALFANITSFNFKESNELAYNKQKKVITTFPEVWEFKFETEEELKVVGDFITNSLKNGVDYANCSKIGYWVSYPDFGWGRKKGAVRISFEQFKERYMTDIPKEDCSKTSEKDIFNTNLLNEAKRRYPNYLISIGQIPDYPIRDRSTDDLSNYGLPTEPPSYMYEMELKHSVSKSKLILSINDEELPMVNIIKTNSIKQLLNIE